MTELRFHRTHRVTVAATAAAALCSAVLAADNTLGFIGSHILGPGAAPVVAVLGVTLAVAGVIFAACSCDAPLGIIALSVAAFLLFRSPALGVSTWPLLATALQALVPIGFAIAAVIIIRRRLATLDVVLAAITAGLALLWALTSFVPLWLPGFLLLQVGTLAAATVLAGAPLIAGFTDVIRGLWSSAEVR